jgi:diguanylate cyclase (GGDEF)-like protein
MSQMPDISLLYVEDEPGVRNSIARSLSLAVKNVYTAENGLEALEMVHRHPVDLIVTDIRMPRMGGLDFIAKLRSEKIDVPVIVTSAFNELEYLNQAIDLKVDKFINKPVRVNTLIDVVTQLSDTIITKRELRTRQQELEHYRRAIEQTNLVMHVGADGSLIGMNRELTDYFETKSQQPVAIASLADLLAAEDIAELMENTVRLNVYSKTVPLSYAGERYTVVLTAFASILDEQTVREITVMFNDITPVIREKEEMIVHLYTDPLTGLPNRQKLFHDLAELEAGTGILIIDIDGFSRLNHLYGFDTGDEILKEMAELLTQIHEQMQNSRLYRSDTDHFVIVLDAESTEAWAANNFFASEIIRKVEEHTFVVGNVLGLDVGVTIGASRLGEDDLYSEALLALEVAKSSRRAFQCFSDLDNVKEHVAQNLSMQRKVKNALAGDLVLNYYQPIVDAQQRVVKYEALVRMYDPDDPEKLLTPFHFLDIVRQSKNYPLLTKRVITNAFRDLAGSPYGIGINLSFDDISNPETVAFLEQLLQENEGAKVTLELLESEGLKDLEQTIRFCQRMKGYGAQIAIDDFGSGYSNFVYFFDMPIDILKIDGSLVRRVHEYRGYVTLEAIIRFARRLGMKTVAEFVEDEATFEKLKLLGVDLFQGYHFAPPKPLEAL